MNTPIYNKLKELDSEKRIPFHMPGHKRTDFGAFFGIEKMDITEITDYDNLHEPEGIIRESMDLVKDIFKSTESWYLVGGSTLGILVSISSVCKPGDKILIGRNCHKAVYNCIRLLQLEAVYCYADISQKYDVCVDMKPEMVEKKLKENPEIKAVVLTSPTYEGVVSDIKGIKKTIQPYGIPLIVDEAHGAHFVFDKYFPDSATKQGADLVIQSTHKTLPSLTQTAVLHLCSDLIKKEQVEEMIDIYETSSPSYLLMASAEYGIMYMKEEKEQLAQYVDNLKIFRKKCEQLQKIELLDQKKLGCFAYDNGKLVFSIKNCGINGKELFHLLYDKYHIELEMENLTYGIAMTSVCDTKENFEKLWAAISEIDKIYDCREKQNELEKKIQTEDLIGENFVTKNLEFVYPPKMMESWQCRGRQVENIKLSDAVGRISGKYVMIYPPGVPILVPGEKILKETVENITPNFLLQNFLLSNLTYGIAMTSVCDTKENFEKLWAAISEIDKIYDCREKQNELEKKIQTEDLIGENFVTKNLEFVYPPKMMESWQCRGRQVENIKLSDAVGRISGKYVMIYPPGVPILVPGEKILKETVENISQYLYNGYNVLGLSKEDQVQVLLKGDFIR